MLNIRPIICLLILGFYCIYPETSLAQKTNWKAPEEANKMENPLEQSEKIVKAGNQIFQQLCAVCHGKEGEGDGITAATLDPKPANLQDSTIQAQSDGAFYWKIREGRPPMPAFKSQLSDKQIWALVTYIKSLGNND